MTEGRFEFRILSKYPHMKPADVLIWERFIEKFPAYFNTVDYDFHVGEGADFLPTGEDTPDERENRLYQKKIDVVGYIDNVAWLIEVKPEAGMSALGQMITYNSLVNKDALFSSPPKLLVLCNRIVTDMSDIFSAHNIMVLVV